MTTRRVRRYQVSSHVIAFEARNYLEFQKEVAQAVENILNRCAEPGVEHVSWTFSKDPYIAQGTLDNVRAEICVTIETSEKVSVPD